MDRKRPTRVPSAAYALAAVYGLVVVGIALIATSAAIMKNCDASDAQQTFALASAPGGGLVLAVGAWFAARRVTMRKPSATSVFVVRFAIVSVAFEIPVLVFAKNCAS